MDKDVRFKTSHSTTMNIQIQKPARRSECGKYRSNRYKEYAQRGNTFILNQHNFESPQFESNWFDVFGHHHNCVCESCVTKKSLTSTI